MRFYQVPEFLANLSSDFGLELFFTDKAQAMIHNALDESGKWNKRNCALKAPIVVWFVVALTVFRAQSMASILKHLLFAFRRSMPDISLREVTPEAMCHARVKLGVLPMDLLFKAVSTGVRERAAASFKHLRVWAVDGVRFLLPDTQENEVEFGRPRTSRGRAAFPQMLAVALIDVTTRLIGGCTFGRCDGSERSGAAKLLDSLGNQDVVLFDRGFPCGQLLEQCIAGGIHFVARISSVWKPHIVELLGPGSCKVQVKLSIPFSQDELAKMTKGRKKKCRLVTFTLRMVEYQIGKEKPVRLLTGLMDASAFPARDLALLYHQRWEAELAYDEIKTHLATVNHGTLHTTFRSKSADGIYQEAYGMLLAYNFVRELIAEAAQEHGCNPLEISFVQSLRLIQLALSQIVAHATKSDMEWRRRQLLFDIANCRNCTRRKRRYPRKVKLKMSNFGVKKPHDQGENVDFIALLELRQSA